MFYSHAHQLVLNLLCKMSTKKYKVNRISEVITYEFHSEGPHGQVRKEIKFQVIEVAPARLYNLSFGELYDDSQDINDSVVTNNKDTAEVLSAVTDAIIDFTGLNKDALIYIEGSAASRTRLYQMWISKLFGQQNFDFLVMGRVKKQWFPFKKGTNYEGFLIRRL